MKKAGLIESFHSTFAKYAWFSRKFLSSYSDMFKVPPKSWGQLKQVERKHYHNLKEVLIPLLPRSRRILGLNHLSTSLKAVICLDTNRDLSCISNHVPLIEHFLEGNSPLRHLIHEETLFLS